MEEVSLYKYLKQCPAIDFKNLSIVIIITITTAMIARAAHQDSLNIVSSFAAPFPKLKFK